MAHKCYDEVMADDRFKLKKFFYALRTATVCRWILEKDEMPPIEFGTLLEELAIEPLVVDRIRELIALKATVSESYFHQGEEAVLNFMRDCMAEADVKAKTLPAARADQKDLDDFFRRTLTD